MPIFYKEKNTDKILCMFPIECNWMNELELMDISEFKEIENPNEDILKFQEALIFSNNEIIIDKTKLKEIIKNKIRIERKPLLDNLDIQFMRNLEQGIDNSEVIKQKQKLRNITKQIDKIDDLEKLKNFKINTD